MTKRICNTLCLICITSLLIITGCVTTQSTNKTFYLLPEPQSPIPTSTPETPVLSIRSVKLPSYLNQHGIAQLLPSGQVSISPSELWAEKLSHAIPTLLANTLTNKLGNPVELHPLPPGVHIDRTLSVTISQFIASPRQLRLQASYRLVHNGHLRSLRFATDVNLTSDDMQTLVNAYGIAIERLAIDIQKNL